jgi:hypothetical protein
MTESFMSIGYTWHPLCWYRGPLEMGMPRCDRKHGHQGPHTWEMAAAEEAAVRWAVEDLWPLFSQGGHPMEQDIEAVIVRFRERGKQ